MWSFTFFFCLFLHTCIVYSSSPHPPYFSILIGGGCVTGSNLCSQDFDVFMSSRALEWVFTKGVPLVSDGWLGRLTL